MSTLPVILLAAAMVVAGVGFVYYLVRGNVSGRPEGLMQWTATGLSTLLVVTSGVLLVLSVVVYSGGGSVQTDGFGGVRAGDVAGAVETGQKAVPFEFRLVEDDAARSLADYEGQVVLLNFWATWCAPCLQELPDLDALYTTYEEEGLVVLTLSDESPDVLRDFMQETPLQTIAGYLSNTRGLPAPFGRTMSIRPTSYVIDREGTIRQFVAGARDYDFFEQAILPLL